MLREAQSRHPPWTYINVTPPWKYINVTPVKAHIHHSRENAHPSPLRKRTSITPAKLHQRHPGESASASARRKRTSVSLAKAHQRHQRESAHPSPLQKRTSVTPAKAGGQYCVLLLGSRLAPPRHPRESGGPVLRAFAGFPPGSTTSPPRRRGAGTAYFCWVPAWLHHVTPAKAGGRYCVLLLGSRLAPPRHPREGGGAVLCAFAGFPLSRE